MGFDFEESELNALALEQPKSLLQALLLASISHPDVPAADIQNVKDYVGKLPWVLNPHYLEETLAEAQPRFADKEPKDYPTFLAEIAAHLTDPVLREKTLVAMGRASRSDSVHEHDPGVLGCAIEAFQIAPDRLELIKQLLAAEDQAQAPADAAPAP